MLQEGKRKERAKESEPDFAQKYARHQDVRDAFLKLEEEERLIVSFSVFGGYSSEEIGGMLKMNAATVRSRKSRALGKMRRMLEEERKRKEDGYGRKKQTGRRGEAQPV